MSTDRNRDTSGKGLRIVAAWIGIAALAMAVARCSMGAGYGAPTAPAPSAAGAPSTGQVLTAQATSLGVILVDGGGRTVYEFANDTNGTSTCTGVCAANWPPVAAPSPLPAPMPGVSGQLGAISRPDGTSQLAVAGHPLYTFAGDTAPGQTNGQGKTLDGGASAAGAPVANANPAVATPPPPVGPGY